MRTTWLAALFALCAPLAAQEGAQLRMDLDHLEERADEVVTINLDGESLERGRKLLVLKKGVAEPVKSLVGKLKGIYLRRFWFKGKKQYSKEEDVSPIHEQVAGPNWVPLIEVKDRTKAQSVSVYSYVENEEVTGVTVVSEDHQEFTVLNIVGTGGSWNSLRSGGRHRDSGHETGDNGASFQRRAAPAARGESSPNRRFDEK